ncbi:Transcription initiation factor IIB [Cucumispora dikerogammari]|nr:Transcription initiation factor IIB [Cucumispora dikerogammari]
MAPLKLNKNNTSCPNCNSQNSIIEDSIQGHTVCRKCGLITEDRLISTEKEWRNLDDDSPTQSRIGSLSNPLLDNNVLDTLISGSAHNFLSKTHLKNMVRGKEAHLRTAYTIIQNFCERNNFPKNVLDRSKSIYRIAETKNILKGKPINAVVGACIYIACRHEGCPRTFKEVCSRTGVPKKDISKCFNLIWPHLDKIKGIFTEDIVARFCSDLKIGIEEQKWAVMISKNLRENGCLAGKSPDSVAAAVIYLITILFNEHENKRCNIGRVAKVTDGTIKGVFKEMQPFLGEIVPIELREKLRGEWSEC